MISAIVVAGGEGERLGREGGKQLACVAGSPLLSHTLRMLEQCPTLDAVVVVAHPMRVDEYRDEAVSPFGFEKVKAVVAGGPSRADSVRAGLAAVPAETDIVIVHDGARPLVSPETITKAVKRLEDDGACAGVVVGHPAYDTLKVVGEDGSVLETLDREKIWIAQTPQVFRASALREAHQRAVREGWTGTDDASIVEQAGGIVRLVAGPRDNLKVTVPEDLPVIEAVLNARAGRGPLMWGTRIGFGYDVHAFAQDRPLVLGGVTIPYDRGLAGYSDADVLVHALMDAIIGAMREGDIGALFPDSDPAYEGISSIELLRHVSGRLCEQGFALVDVDTVLVLEEPKVAPFRDAMRSSIASALGVEAGRIGVKATTTEGLGFAGRGEGVAAYAVAVLEKTSC